jgi:hypothetical protein
VAGAWFLGLALFCATLGVGYLTWSLFTWRQGRTPAQRMLRLRCWLPLSGQVAGRKDMAVRQISGLCLNGQALSGFLIWLFGENLRSVGDVFADTMILYDPDEVLALPSAASTPAVALLAVRLRTRFAAGFEPLTGDGRVLEPPPMQSSQTSGTMTCRPLAGDHAAVASLRE